MEDKESEIIKMMSDRRSQEKGLRQMMDTYQNRLYLHIRRMVIEHGTAQDVLQETFIKAFRNFHQFQGDSRLYTWLYRIATNEALHQLNKTKKTQKLNDDNHAYIQNLIADNSHTDAEQIQIILQQAIGILPEKQRLVFNMRYYDNFPYEEMSRVLDMSVATLKTNYHYAKQKIENYIKQHFDG